MLKPSNGILDTKRIYNDIKNKLQMDKDSCL